MDRIVENHFTRLRTAILRRFSAAMVAQWICQNTKYAGEPYSYLDHEYQERILNDVSREVNVRKCSQVGLSEANARKALALVNILSPYTVAFTLPTAKFAGSFMKTRIDTVIEGSDAMKAALNKNNDNNEIKQFGDSFLWVRGAASSNAPISIPCDHLIHDEVDFSDQEVLGQYQSRLTHSKWKRTDKISTPTLPGFGIDKAFQESRRHFLFCKCNHCGFQFIPSYYDHVRVPDYDDDLRKVSKYVLGKIKWQQAQLHCPKCDKVPDLGPEYREWVCENPDSGLIAAGYQVSPFDAPKIIVPSFLVEQSTKYDRIQDFENFNLGLPSEDKEATLTRQDLLDLHTTDSPGAANVYVMGVDVGNTYHFVIAAVNAYDQLHVVHRERVHMSKAKERYEQLRLAWRVVCTVIDSGPHSETVMSLQERDQNCYAAVYVNKKTILTHQVVHKDEEEGKGQEFLRQVNVNRSRAFDAYMNVIRDRQMLIMEQPEGGEELREAYIQHHTSMKRVKVYDNDSGEMMYSWQKSDGQDHFHHASLYCFIASRVRGMGRSLVALPTASLYTFRLKPQMTQR